MHRRTLMILTSVLTAFLLVAAVTCGDDDDGNGTTTTGTPSPTETGETTTAAPTDAPTETASPAPESPTEEPFSGDRDPVEKEGPAVPPVAVQTDVRYAEHADFDRVVFDFMDNAPGYRVEYVDPPILADGSGNEVEIAGEAFLQVRFSTAQAHDEEGNLTIDELEIMPGLDSVVEIERTGDFEGYVTWVLGLPEELDFRVSDLTDPFRVVVDIAHP